MTHLTKLVRSVNLGYHLCRKLFISHIFYLQIFTELRKELIFPLAIMCHYFCNMLPAIDEQRITMKSYATLSTTFHFCVDGRDYVTLLRSILYSISSELLRNSKIIVTNVCLGPGRVAY
jgi:hypothetical protein